jgi:hypothetical protein
MTTTSSMPGHWPFHDEAHILDPSPYPRLNTPVAESSLQVPRIVSTASSSRDSAEEQFFDCQTPNPDHIDEPSSPSYLIFEPVVSTVSDQEPTDWRRYEPPNELLNSKDDTSEVIRGMLEPSVAGIRSRHVEEEERRAANARRERPLGRVGRASVKPQRNVSKSVKSTTNGTDRLQMRMSGGLDPLQHDHSRLSAGSATSLLSDDSGYASMTLEVESPSSRSTNRKLFGLGALFKRMERLTTETRNGESPATKPASPISRQVSAAEPPTK